MKTNIRLKLAALAAFIGLATAAHAAPGGLDATFGTGGKVTTAVGSGNDYGSGVAIQADGKIVVAGDTSVSGTSHFALVRYNTSGIPDTTFDADGKVATLIGNDSSCSSMALQPDGKIVVAGYVVNGEPDFALHRYNADGSLDTTFSGDGIVSTAGGSGADYANSVAVQPDGKIVVAGYLYNESFFKDDFALVRYDANGSPDLLFNGGFFDGNNLVTTDFGQGSDKGFSVALQPDGKIVVAGVSGHNSNDDFAIARYNADGSLDTTFSGDGRTTTAIGGDNEFARAVALQPDGKIVAAGSTYNGSDFDFALVRYNTDGSLDTTFNGTGKLATDFGGEEDQAFSVAVQADGKILVAGQSDNGGSYNFALARYNTDGSLDTTFNGTGKVDTDFGGGFDAGSGMALQADGKIIVAGQSDNGDSDFAVARYSVALPDTRLGATAAAPVGNNRYNLTGAGQTLNTAIKHGGGVKTDFIRIQNDGPVREAFKVKGTPGNAKFIVKYLNGAADVTRRVVAGTFSTGSLNPGATKLLKAVITAKTPLPAQKRSLFINATAASDAAGRDTALIKARSN